MKPCADVHPGGAAGGAQRPRQTKSRQSVLNLRSQLRLCIEERSSAQPPAGALEGEAPLVDVSNKLRTSPSPRALNPDPPEPYLHAAAPPPLLVDTPQADALPASRTIDSCSSDRRRMAAIPPQAAPWRGIAADAIAFISYALAEALEARECVDAAAATGDASARGEAIRKASRSLLGLCSRRLLACPTSPALAACASQTACSRARSGRPPVPPAHPAHYTFWRCYGAHHILSK